MAKDILDLEIDGEQMPPPPPPPGQQQTSPLVAVADATKPQAVPDLDLLTGATERNDSSPMAPDFFFSASRNKSSRNKSARHKSSSSRSKAKLWKVSR